MEQGLRGLEQLGFENESVNVGSDISKVDASITVKENATVTYCHSKTKDLTDYTKKADILIVACGKK